MKKGDKSNKRLPHDPNKIAAIRATAKKFKVSESYVRLSISKTVTYGQSDDIRQHYAKIYNQIQSITA